MRRAAARWPVALALVVPLVGCSSGSSPAPAAPTRSTASTASPSVTPTGTASTGTWPRVVAGRVATLPTGLSRTVAVRRGGAIVLLGGLGPGDVTTGRVWRLDVRSRRTTTAGSLAEAVHDASGAVLGGQVVVFGGGAATEVADAQAWTTGTARVVGRLPDGRSDSAAAVVGGTAYVVGGYNGSAITRDIAATRSGRTFRVAGRLHRGVRYPAVTAFDGAVWVVGGDLATTTGTTGGAQTAAIQRFDPATGRTTVVGRLPQPLGHAMAFTLGGRLFVAGGRSAAGATDTVWSIDPSSGAVHRAGRLPQPRSDAAVVNVGDSVWLVGGERTGPLAPLRSVVRVRLAP